VWTYKIDYKIRVSHIHCCLSMNVMDDRKLNTTPVVRLETPSKTYVQLV